MKKLTKKDLDDLNGEGDGRKLKVISFLTFAVLVAFYVLMKMGFFNGW